MSSAPGCDGRAVAAGSRALVAGGSPGRPHSGHLVVLIVGGEVQLLSKLRELVAVLEVF